MLHESEVTRLQTAWAIEEAPAGLAARIVAHATAQPQRRPWGRRLRRLFAEQRRRHAAICGLAFAACLTVAVIATETTTSRQAPPATTPVATPAAKPYKVPMEKMLEELLWNDYSY